MDKGEILCDGDRLAGVNTVSGARGGGATDVNGIVIDGAAVAAASALISWREWEI